MALNGLFGSTIPFVKIATITALGLFIALMGYDAYINARTQFYLLMPVTSVYEATIYVPDFKIGEDPEIQYSRDAHVDVNTSTISDIKEAVTGQTICRRYSLGHVDANAPPPAGPIKLDAYFGVNCKPLKAGRYFIETEVRLSREGLPDRFARVFSNNFTVSPDE